MNLSRVSLFIAIFFLIASALIYFLENNGLQLFKLPGDFIIKKNNISIYIPISSMIFNDTQHSQILLRNLGALEVTFVPHAQDHV